ncbi:MAG TPA: transaldolase [Acidimicrobiia bacterium]|nr:transaldolase [Acidimicrobiia bacterium]
MPKSRLHGLAAAGQSIWSDQLSREMIDGGELERRISEDAVSGVTSNPTIFAGAITKGAAYDRPLQELAKSGHTAEEIVTKLMTADIADACDVLRSTWEWSEGGDGFVSVEVSPLVAHETDATVAEAREWVKRIDRPNLLVKVPATAAGVDAIRRLTAEGISINVTLVFSLPRYAQVMEAYQKGLAEYAEAGGKLKLVNSVGSFFVSRVDTEVDKRLEGVEGGDRLMGKIAIAQARVAYGMFLERFRTPEWMALERKGGRVQRPLWASTSTKNPAYPDVMYVEHLVAPHTINTMPLETMDAFQDHGTPLAQPFGEGDVAQAQADLDRLAEIGIDLDDVSQVLEDQGVDKFAKSWDELLADVEAERVAAAS